MSELENYQKTLSVPAEIPPTLRWFEPTPYVGDVSRKDKLEASDWNEGEAMEGEDKGRTLTPPE